MFASLLELCSTNIFGETLSGNTYHATSSCIFGQIIKQIRRWIVIIHIYNITFFLYTSLVKKSPSHVFYHIWILGELHLFIQRTHQKLNHNYFWITYLVSFNSIFICFHGIKNFEVYVTFERYGPFINQIMALQCRDCLKPLL